MTRRHRRMTMRALDAKDACLRLLSERRTRGRLELHLAVEHLYEWLAGYCDNCGAKPCECATGNEGCL